MQTLMAINYLHTRNIYYGDMKPANLLIFRNQEVKIGDLGISIKMQPNDMAHMRNRNNIFEELKMDDDLDLAELGIDFFVMDEEVKNEGENGENGGENKED